MTTGYMGKILWVNLSDEIFNEEQLPNEIYRQYLGGYGLGAKIIYDNLPKNVDPLGSEALLGFFPGLLTGTVAPLSGRYMVVGKSPLTGTWGDANSGGYFGPEIKKCGYDGIIFRGIADSPKIVVIINDDKQIIDASDLWGKDCVQTEEELKTKYEKAQVASIGQAGENLSLISGVINDKGRAAGRSGFGALMGSKKLKAIVLKGNKTIQLSDKDAVLNATKEYNERINTSTAGLVMAFKTYGTTAGNVLMGTSGDTPIKNWGGISADDFPVDRMNNLSPMALDKFKQKPFGCFSCPVRCGAIMRVSELGIEETHRPEYETCASFGPLILNDDLMSIFELNDICNRACLDTISAGATVAFAIECYENGLINKNDTDGLELSWGNSKAVIELLKKIINREGIGDILADGSKKASEKIGKGSEEYAITSLGQELGMHDAKYYKSLGMSFAFDPTPGRHTSASLDMVSSGPIAKGALIEGFALPRKFRRDGDDRYEAHKMIAAGSQVISSLGLCYFSSMFPQYPFFQLIKAIVGWDMSVEEMIKTGLRIQTLRQTFTIREGVDIASNKLPGRVVGNPPFESGPHKDKTIDYQSEYKGYCEKMGWNPENGYPLKETLMNLNLDFVIKDLY